MAFRSAFTKNDLISAATVVLQPGQFNLLGTRQVNAGEVITIGYGDQSGQESAQGRIYMDLRDNTASPGVLLPGKVRLVAYTPNNRFIANLGEWRTETLGAGAGDRTKQVPLPEDVYEFTEDKKICLEFLPDSAASVTLSKANSTVIFDTTESEE